MTKIMRLNKKIKRAESVFTTWRFRRTHLPWFSGLILGLLILSLLLPGPALANPTGPAGRPGIDPSDPHRFVIDGKPWYPIGYYPAIAALTVDQTDYENFYREYIDVISSNGINYMRNSFSIGQPFGDSMTPYLRTGPGQAADGRPKFDLTQYNQEFFDYWREVISYAGSKGVVVQLIIFDAWHNKDWITEDYGDEQHEFGMKHDFYIGSNNTNGINAHNPESWSSTTNPIYDHQKALIREIIDTFGDLPNIVFEICNENYTNPDWELELADYLTSYEKSKGFSPHLVMPRDLPNHDSAGGKFNDPWETHNEMVSNFWNGQPLITDNDGGGNVDADTRRKKAWAALTAGGHIDYFHWELFQRDLLYTESTQAGMQYLGLLGKFLRDFSVDLRGMRPGDDQVDNGWVFSKPGKRYIIYLIDGGSTTIHDLDGDYQATWFNPRDGSHQAATDGPTFSAPDGDDWVLYVKTSADDSGGRHTIFIPGLFSRK